MSSESEKKEMRAVVVERAGGFDVLKIKKREIPEPEEGWSRIKVMAFGINRSEVLMRQGASHNQMEFPIIMGTEVVGILDKTTSEYLTEGKKVVSAMGGMGRSYDGSYAEYVVVPNKQIYAINTEMDWRVLATIPGMYLTAWGSLIKGLELKAEDTLLIRGASSSVGLAALQIAKDMGVLTMVTTRSEEKAALLRKHGADQVVIDDDNISKPINTVMPGGIDKVLELVGAKTLKDSIDFTAENGIICVSGSLGGTSKLYDFDIFDLPSTKKLTTYRANAADLRSMLQYVIPRVVSNEFKPIIDDMQFELEDIQMAHDYMESNKAIGKMIINVDHEN